MSFEIYVRYVGAYGGGNAYAEEKLEACGFLRLKSPIGRDQFWLADICLAKGELAKELEGRGSESSKEAFVLSWTQRHSHAGQIAVVREMLGATPG